MCFRSTLRGKMLLLQMGTAKGYCQSHVLERPERVLMVGKNLMVAKAAKAMCCAVHVLCDSGVKRRIFVFEVGHRLTVPHGLPWNSNHLRCACGIVQKSKTARSLPTATRCDCACVCAHAVCAYATTCRRPERGCHRVASALERIPSYPWSLRCAGSSREKDLHGHMASQGRRAL